MSDPLRERGRQFLEIGKLVKTILTGSREEIVEKVAEAGADVQAQVDEHKTRRRLINDGSRVERPPEGRPRR